MPGGPKPAKNMQQQQRGQKQQQQVDRPRGQDRKQVNKLPDIKKQGGKQQGDKQHAGPKGDGGKQQAGPKGDGGKKFGDYLKDKDRDRDGGNKAAGGDKKDGKDPDRPGLGDYLKDKDRGRPDDGKHADDKDKGGKDHHGDGKHAGDDKDDKGGKDGKGHDDDGKHADDKYPGGKQTASMTARATTKGPSWSTASTLCVEEGQRLREARRARPGLLRLADGQDRQVLRLRPGLHLASWRLLPAAGRRGRTGRTRLRSGRTGLRAGRTRA